MTDNKSIVRILKIDALVLFGGALLLTIFSLLSGQQFSGTFILFMLAFNFAGVVGNFLMALVFGLQRRRGRCLGAIIGGVLFGLVGFGLCLGCSFVLDALGVTPFPSLPEDDPLIYSKI